LLGKEAYYSMQLGEEVNYDRLHKELLKFHNKYYYGNFMKLVVIGGGKILIPNLLKFYP
jgi:hypothetical protein